GHDPVFVNGGHEFGMVCTATGGNITDNPNLEQDTQEWAGWEKPIPVYGTGFTNEINFTGNLVGWRGTSTRDDWYNLLRQRDIVVYRDCQGRKVFGILGLGFSTTGGVTGINLSVSETHHIEGVRDALPVPDGDE
ncbi:MAG TPA: hypothetical protein VK054_02545, partial [Beutenbergiaceae bacterium]|nr:hypothetical protein [Beutenbergiaceae bacterium]